MQTNLVCLRSPQITKKHLGISMQQQLQQLAHLATLAGQKGLPETQKQLNEWRDQLALLGSVNIHPVLVALIERVIAGLQHKLTSDVALTDAALKQECLQQSEALFQAYTLINEAAKQFQQLDQDNARARTNQKYFDQNKNEARERFNTYLGEVATQAELDAADLREFNRRLRAMLEQDFAVNHLPREAAPSAQPESMRQAPVIQDFLSNFSNVVNSVNSNDQEGMKNAASNFVGFLIDMVVESIATLCRNIAPSIAPFISQMAQFAKGAFGHIFNTGIQTAATAQAAATGAGSTKTAVPRAPRSAQTPSTTASTTTPSMSDDLLSATQQFIQRNSRPQSTTAAQQVETQSQSVKTAKRGLLGNFLGNAFQRFKQNHPPVKAKPTHKPHSAPVAPTGHPTVGLTPRKPRHS